MTKEYVLSRLCVYDKRNPDYIPYDEDDESRKPTDCGCDNCFYGRTILSEKILQLNQAIEDNKEKKYIEEDMKLCYMQGWNRGKENKSTEMNNYIQFISQSKTSWEVEFVDGKFKLK